MNQSVKKTIFYLLTLTIVNQPISSLTPKPNKPVSPLNQKNSKAKIQVPTTRATPQEINQIKQHIDHLKNYILTADKPGFDHFLQNLKKLMDKTNPEQKKDIATTKREKFTAEIKKIILMTDDKPKLSSEKQLITDLAKDLGVTVDLSSIPDPAPEPVPAPATPAAAPTAQAITATPAVPVPGAPAPTPIPGTPTPVTIPAPAPGTPPPTTIPTAVPGTPVTTVPAGPPPTTVSAPAIPTPVVPVLTPIPTVTPKAPVPIPTPKK